MRNKPKRDPYAKLAELAYAADLKSVAARHVGSSPTEGTMIAHYALHDRYAQPSKGRQLIEPLCGNNEEHAVFCTLTMFRGGRRLNDRPGYDACKECMRLEYTMELALL